MAQALNSKAADHHEAAAKLHRSAAEMIGKHDAQTGLDHSTKALAQSEIAHKASTEAQTKSAAPAPKV